MSWVYDDGGRAACGYAGLTSDCVTQAVAIACEKPYREVREAMDSLGAEAKRTWKRGEATSSRLGMYDASYAPYLKKLGWVYVVARPKTKLRASMLPPGRIIVSLNKHLVAVIGGALHDTHDCSHGGERPVKGYYKKEEKKCL